MAKGVYIGEASLAKKIKDVYIGVNNTAKKVSKGYIGVNGVAKLFYQDRWLYEGYIIVGTQRGSEDVHYYLHYHDPETGAMILEVEAPSVAPNPGFGTTPGKLYVTGRNRDNSRVVHLTDPFTMSVLLTSGTVGRPILGKIAGTNNGELWVSQNGSTNSGEYQPKRLDPDTLAVIGTATISYPTPPGSDRFEWSYDPYGGTNGVMMLRCTSRPSDGEGGYDARHQFYDYDTTSWAAINTPAEDGEARSYDIEGDMVTEDEIYGNFYLASWGLWSYANGSGYGRFARMDRNTYATLYQYSQAFYAHSFGPKVFR